MAVEERAVTARMKSTSRFRTVCLVGIAERMTRPSCVAGHRRKSPARGEGYRLSFASRRHARLCRQ